VPGWFQATLALQDAKGKELAFDDDYRFHPDPVLHYKIPSEGEYVIEVRDAIYRGREDFVYRIALGDLPFVTSVFPAGSSDRHNGSRGNSRLEPARKPDPARRATSRSWDPSAADGARGPGIESGAVCAGYFAECREQEPNGPPSTAQSVTLPLIVNGRIDAPDDRDVFRFEGEAGDVVVAESWPDGWIRPRFDPQTHRCHGTAIGGQ